MKPANQRVVDAAEALGLQIELREFPEGTRTAQDAANAIGCEIAQIVKSLVFVADGEPVVAFTSGEHQLDTAKLARAAGATDVRKATPDEARDATGFAIGGTPPFGHAMAVRVFFDETLLHYDEVWAAGGTPSSVFAIRPRDLLDKTGAIVVDVRAV